MAFKVGDMDLIILHCLAIRTCLMFAEIRININVLLKDVQWTTWSISMGNFPKQKWLWKLCANLVVFGTVLANQQSYIIFYHDQLFNVEFHTCTSIKLSFFCRSLRPWVVMLLAPQCRATLLNYGGKLFCLIHSCRCQKKESYLEKSSFAFSFQ